ncbi:hypothetical protein HK104_005111, partial [Borealophlyctis nickersoniae]
MEERLVSLQERLMEQQQQQQRALAAQTNLLNDLVLRLNVGGSAALMPQPPLPLQPPMTTHYSRVPSPTPSSVSSIPASDIARDISKSIMAAIPKYDGLGNAQKLYEYIQHVEEYLELTEVSAKEQLYVGTHKLTDKARDWRDAKRLLLKRFTTKEQQLLVRQQLFQIKQTGTVTDYTHRFDMLLMQLPQRDTEETYVTVYLNGLKEEVKKA